MSSYNGVNPVVIGYTAKASHYARVFGNTQALKEGGVALDFMRIAAGAAPVPAAGEGTIYFDSVAQKFKKSENGGAFGQLGAIELIFEDSGSDSTGSAHGITETPISGLTVADTLRVLYWLRAGSGTLVYPQLYDTAGTPDGLSMLAADGSDTPTSVSSGVVIGGVVDLWCDPNDDTTYFASRRGHVGHTFVSDLTEQTGRPGWTTNWTLQLRCDAAPATTYYKFQVFKIAG